MKYTKEQREIRAECARQVGNQLRFPRSGVATVEAYSVGKAHGVIAMCWILNACTMAQYDRMRENVSAWIENKPVVQPVPQSDLIESTMRDAG